MKKTLLLILIGLVLLNLMACGKSNDEKTSSDNLTKSATAATKEKTDATDSNLDEATSASSDLSVTSSTEKNVETYVKRLINAVDGTKIDSLTVMKAENTVGSENYNVYAIITWNRKHTPSDSQQIIKDFSDNFAGSIDTKLGNVEDLSLVWRVSNLNGTASITYEKTDGMLTLKEETYDKNFGITTEGTTGTAIQSTTGSAVNTSVTESVVNN